MKNSLRNNGSLDSIPENSLHQEAVFGRKSFNKFVSAIGLMMLLLVGSLSFGQTSVQNFGTTTGSNTSQTASTSLIPTPTGTGTITTYARAGAAAPSAPIALATASNPLGTTGAYLKATASSTTSVSKASPIIGYAGSTQFYTSFKVLFGDSSGGNTATSGSWTFAQGPGTTTLYNDNNQYTSANAFVGLRFTYGSSGALTLSYDNSSNATFTTSGLTTSSFNQGTVYTIEIVGNNAASGSLSYNYNGVAQTTAVQTYDLYINGTRIGNDLAYAFCTTGANITSMTYTGISSTSNAAYLFVDDVTVYNSVPANIGINTITSNAVTGNWSSASSWVNGVVPGSADNVVIVSGATITMDTATNGINTRNSGTTTTINSGGTLATGVTYTNNGTTTVNGSFQLNGSGWVTSTSGTNDLIYGSSGTLIFNTTYTANSGNYWPTSSGPVNVTVNTSCPLTLGFARTVSGTFQTYATVTNPGNLTIGTSGTLQLNSGYGWSGTGNPIYGSSSLLLYNSGGTPGRSTEWTASSGTIGTTAGYPNNVQLSSTTTLNFPNGTNSTYKANGTLIIDYGSTLYQNYNSSNSSLIVGSDLTVNGNLTLGNGSGDLTIGGNLTVGSAATFNTNGRYTFFNGSANQTITKTGAGTVAFDYLVINKSAGNLVLSSSPATDVTVGASSGNVLQLINAGSLDLNGRTLSLNNNGGGIYVDGARTITSTLTGGSLAINQGKYVGNNSGTGALIIAPNVTVNLNTNGNLDFGKSGGTNITTLNGTLSINSGTSCYVNNNPPIYGTGSTLIYNSGTTYGRGTEWSTTSGAGYPYHVTIQTTNTVVDMGANSGQAVARAMAGDLTISTGATFTMDNTNNTMTQPVTVNGSVINSGTIKLSSNGTGGGDLKLGGNFTQNGTFTPNGRALFFTGAAASTQLISASSSPVTIPYIVMGSAGNTVKLSNTSILATAVNGGNAIDFGSSASNVFDLNGNNITIGTSGQTCNFAGSGFFKGNSASTMTVQGTSSTGSLGFVTTQQLSSLTVNLSAGGVTLSSPLTTATLAMTSGSLSLNGNAVTVSSVLSGSGTIQNNHASTAATLTVSATGNNTFAGSLINGAAATLALTNSGTGTLNLSGANSYTGATLNTSGGTVGITNTNTSAITNSATAKLAGTGSTTGAVNIASGTSITPGTTGTIGTLTTGPLTLNGTYTFDINSLPSGTSGTNWDYISCTTLTTTGFTLAVSGTMPSFSASTSYQWKIGAYSSTLTASGTYTVSTTVSGVTATGVFSVTITGGFIYLNYTPPSAPTVTSPTSASISYTTATLGGNVTNTGGSTLTEVGVLYAPTATNSNPQLNGSGVIKVTASATTGVFTISATGLTSGTGYSFVAYATNAVGTTYTTPVSTFTTTATTAPIVAATPSSTNITNNSATLGGNVTATGGSTLTEVGVVYSLTSSNSNPQIGGTGVTKVTTTAATGVFTISATGLTPSSGYSYVAYAINANGTSYSSVSTFSTVATVLPIWTFETSAPTTTGPISPETGSGTASISNANGTVNSPTGNGSNKSYLDTNWSLGDYFQFQFSTTGISNIGFSFDHTGSATGPRDFKVQYSTNGSSFTNLPSGSYVLTNDSWSSSSSTSASTRSFNLSSVTALNNQSNVYIRLTVYSTTSINGGLVATGGTSRVDNVTVYAIPTITGAATATAFTTTYGAASVAQTFPISGTNLTANIIATAPTGFEVSSNGTNYGSTATFTQSSGSASGTLSIRLAATASVSGSYNSQNIVLSSTGAVNVNITTASTGNIVSKATPTIITAPTATTITYGQTLASSTLSGGFENVSGTFAFTTPSTIANAGTASQSVTFTPTDTTNYNTITTTVSVTVNQATPTITTAPTASAITYGQTLASSSLSGGLGSVAGTFAFTTPSTAPNAGTASQGYTFTPTSSNYVAITSSVSVTVNKATPTVSVAPSATNICSGQTLASSTLSGGTASVAGSFSFTTSSTVPSVGTASQSVTFTPTDTSNYNTATTNSSVTVIAAATANAGTAVSTCATAGAVNITAGSTATNNASVTWTSSGTGTFANANSLTLATYTPSNADITAGTVTLTLTAVGNSPCGNATSNKTLTISSTTTWNGSVDTNWNNASNWSCGIPTSIMSVVIPDTTTTNNRVPVLNTGTDGSVNSLTINSNGSFTMGGTKILNITSGGSFINSGTFTAGTGTVNFVGSGTITGTTTFNNVTLNGGVNFGSASTIGASGSLQINAGGFVNTNAPIYNATSTLIYNSGTSNYGRSTEWNSNSGIGYPGNVTIQNNSTVLWGNPGTDLGIAGNLTLGATGSTGSLTHQNGNKIIVAGNVTIGSNSGTSNLSLSSNNGGDIKVGGNWTRTANGTFTPNGRAVFFTGSGTNIITASGGSSFDYVVSEKTGGSIQLGSDMTANAPSGGNSLSLKSAASFDLNGYTLNLTNATASNVQADGGAVNFIGSTGSTINITSSNKTFSQINSGTFVFGSNVAITTSLGVDFGSNVSTVNGTLQINAGGFLTGNAPSYGNTSTLVYNSGGTYGRNLEWGSLSGAGYPNNVTVQGGTTLNLAANGFADRALAGNLTLGVTASSGSLSMGASTNKLTIGKNIIIGGNTSGTSNLSLSSAIGGDVYVNGDWTRNTNGSFTTNGRAVFFQGTLTSTITTITAASFDYLFINKTGTNGKVILANDMTVNNNLTFSSGNTGVIQTGTNKVIIPSGSGITRSGSGHIFGNLQMDVPTGASSRNYVIGDASNYTPVMLAHSSVTTAGTIVGTTISTDQPSISTSGINTSKSANRYYTFTNSGVAGGSYDGTFNFVSGDLDSSATTSNFVVRRYASSAWNTTTVGAKTSTSTQATGIATGSYGDFQLGETGTLSFDTNPSNSTVCSGTGTTFTVVSTSSPAPSVQWQSSLNGSSWNNITTSNQDSGTTYSGYTTSTLTLTGSTTALNGYQYRAVISNINGSATSTAATLTVKTNTAITAQPATSTTRCLNGTAPILSFSTNGTNLSYQWYSNTINNTSSGTLISGETGTSFTASTASSGTTYYYAIITGDCGTVTTNTAAVIINALPTATISAGGATTFCQGGSVNLTSSTGSSYLWSNGATTSSITVSASGSYTVQVTNSNGCQSAASSATAVTVNTTPSTPTISAGGATTFCQGGSVTLTSSTGSSYLWSNGATTSNITVSDAGDYSVQITNSNGCQSAASAATTVTVNATPSTPTISAGGATTFCQGGSVTLSSSTGSSYLWSNGATTSSITVSDAGDYSVQITNSNGCQSAVSTATTVTVNATPSTPTISAGGTTTFCQGGSVTLTSSTGSSYLWSNGATTSSITVSDAGDYSVQITNFNGCQSAASAATTVTVNATPSTPTISAGGATTFCQGESVTLASSTGSSYAWSNGATTSSITVSDAGDYSVQITNSNGCQSSASTATTVTVNATPSTPTISTSGATTFCQGGSVTLTSSTGSSYAWSNGATTSSITVSEAGDYSVQITNSNGCQSAASTATTVTVNATPSTPTISTSGATTFCQGGSVTLTSSTGSSYAWSNGATTSSITVSDAGDYSVQITNSNGCQSAASTGTTVTVNATPIVTASDVTGCTGTSITLAGSTTSTGGTGSYNVSNPYTGSSATYTYTYTDGNGCSATSDYANITVNSNVTASFSIASSICSGTTAPSLSTTSDNGISGSWAPSTISNTASGTYTFTPTTAAQYPSCYRGTSVTVTVTEPNVTPTFTQVDPICSGAILSSLPTTSEDTVGITGTWSPSLNNTATTTYTFTPDAGQCAVSTTMTITVNPNLPASVSIQADVTTICAGASVTFTATPTNGGSSPSYQWKVNGVNVDGETSSTFISSTLANSDVVTVVMSSSASPCSTNSPATSNAITITVNPGLSAGVSITATATTICTGTNVTFTATSTNGGSFPSYQWQVNGSNVGTNSASFSSSALNDADEVSVIMTSNATSCITSASATSNIIVISVNPNLPASVNIDATATSICSGTGVTFTATPTNGGLTPTYQWKVNGNNVSGQTTSTFTSTTLSDNDVVSVVMVSNASPCLTGSPATSNTISMAVSPTANRGTISDTAFVCAGSSTTVSISGTVGAIQWQVSTDGANWTDILGANSATLNTGNLTVTTYYQVIVTSGSCAPATSDIVTVIVNDGIIASIFIEASATTICSGTSVTFTATPTNEGDAPSYQWQINGINVAGATDPTFTSSSFANNDVVKVVLSSNATPCLANAQASSNTLTMTVNPNSTSEETQVACDSYTWNGETYYTTGDKTFTSTNNYGCTNVATLHLTINNSTTSEETQVVCDSYTWHGTTYNSSGDYTYESTNSSGCTNVATLHLTVNPSLPASVTIDATATTICSGTTITFTATPTNGGQNPSYQWKVNGEIIDGETSSTYSSNTFANSDIVTVVMTSNAYPCLTNSPTTSNEITITVNPNLSASVNIGASATTICSGTGVTFTATPTNGGSAPSYQWQVNNLDVDGETNDTFETTSLNNGDIVRVIMLSNETTCLTDSSATSNNVTITVNPNLQASVSIAASSTNICIGNTVTFTATPTYGGSAPVYQWQINGYNVGSNNATFTSNTLADTDVVSVIMVSNASPCIIGSPATSNAITMTVSQPTSVGTITANDSLVCFGASTMINLDSAQGTVKWWRALVTNGTPGDYYPIPGNYNTLTVPSIYFNFAYKVIVSSGACPQSTSNTVTVAVSPTSRTTYISGASGAICRGQSKTLTLASGSVGFIKWQYNTSATQPSSSDSNWTDIQGATDVSTYIASPTVATWYRVVATSSPCSSVTTNPVQVLVNESPSVGTLSASPATVCFGTQSTLSLSDAQGTISWFKAPVTSNGIGTFVPISGNTSTLNTGALYTATAFKAVATTFACGSIPSNVVTVQIEATVSKATVISALSSSNTSLLPALTACQGSTLNLTLAAGSIGNIQWLYSTNSGSSWTVFATNTAATYGVNSAFTTSTPVLSTDTWFKVIAYNGVCNSAESFTVKIAVSAPIVVGTISGGNNTVCAPLSTGYDSNGNVINSSNPITNSISINLTGSSGSIVWQKSINYGTLGVTPVWTSIVNATSTTPTGASYAGATFTSLTVGNLAATTWYRAKLVNGACYDYSDIVKITVVPNAKATPIISSTTSVCIGGNVTYSLTAGYVGDRIEWYSAPTSTGTYNLVSTNWTYTATNITGVSFSVKAIVYQGTCSSAVSVKNIVVNPLSVAGTVTGAGTVCSGSGGTLKLTGYTGSIQWQYSTNGTNYSNVPVNANASTFGTNSTSGTAATYIVNNLSAATYFRAVVKSGLCSSSTSNIVQFVTGTAANAGTLTALDSSICTGTATTLNLSGYVGSVLRWEKSTNWLSSSAVWTTINSTASSLSTGNLSVSTAFRAVVTIGACNTVTGSYIVINLPALALSKGITANNTSPSGNTSSTAICTTSSSKVLSVTTGYVGTIQWQKSIDNVNFSNISGATTESYTISNPVSGANYYRVVFTNSCGASVNSNKLTVYYQGNCRYSEVQSDGQQAIAFGVKAYPSPFKENFTLNVTTPSEDKVQVMVYDMIGKLVDQRELSPSDAESLEIGDRFPSGVYNVIVTQGDNTKTLRVIKR